MPHIPSHILEPDGSFGTLTLDADPSIVISFLPPPFPLKRGERVGFHPVFNHGHTEIVGFNVARWDDHEMAEGMAISRLKGFKRIEEIYNKIDKKAGVELMISMGGLQDKHREVLRKTLDYFDQADFKHFYVNSAGKADTKNAEKQIIAFFKNPPSKPGAKKKK